MLYRFCITAICFLVLASLVMAEDWSRYDADELGSIAVKNGTLHGVAEQWILRLTGEESMDDSPPVMTLLSMMVSPSKWTGRAFIRIPTDEEFRKRLMIPVDKEQFTPAELKEMRILNNLAANIQFALTEQRPVDQADQMILELFHTVNDFYSAVLTGTCLLVLPPPQDAPSREWTHVEDDTVHSKAVRSRVRQLLEELKKAFHTRNVDLFNTVIPALVKELRGINPDLYPASISLRMDIWETRYKPLRWAFVAYALGAISFLFGVIWGKAFFPILGYVLGILGGLLHLVANGMYFIQGTAEISDLWLRPEAPAWVACVILLILGLKLKHRWLGLAACALGSGAITAGFLIPV
jgi:hypothetical protein